MDNLDSLDRSELLQTLKGLGGTWNADANLDQIKNRIRELGGGDAPAADPAPEVAPEPEAPAEDEPRAFFG